MENTISKNPIRVIRFIRGQIIRAIRGWIVFCQAVSALLFRQVFERGGGLRYAIDVAMNFPRVLLRSLWLLTWFVLAWAAVADPAVPGNVLDPGTTPEAWNVIRLSTANVEQLIREKRWSEIPVQISFCSPALRALARLSGSVETKALTDRTAGWVVALASASMEKNEARTNESLRLLQTNLRELAGQFEPRVVAADIFLCPMHPDFVADEATTPCARCGMTLIPRRIPYSFIYMKPGNPSVQISASVNHPIEEGNEAVVTLQLKTGDGAPVRQADLVVMHTKPIHLLIEEPSLGDYHHEHPVPTATPGQYTFTFTPAKTAPYRLWADIVPAATGIQELPFVDLPSAGHGGGIEKTGNVLSCSRGGLKFTLTFNGGPSATPHAQQTCGMRIMVTEADGRPVQRLEPLMNAFAHLVGFYDDYRTVVHLHPGGGEVLREEARGGPSLLFTFFPPKPGFLRLYCQVQVKGENIFAPFDLNIEP